MRVLILGMGDAFSSGHFGSSALIEAPQGRVLLDCPDPIHRAIRQAAWAARWEVAITDIHDVLITHLHGDHTNGLESFAYAHFIKRMKNDAHPVPRLHINAPAGARVWEKLAPAMDEAWPDKPKRALADFFDLRKLDPQTPASVAGLTVRCRFAQHPIPTTGFLISDGKRTLGWSSDTTYDPQHIAWLSEADLIVHEAGGGKVHTDIAQLDTQPDSIKNKMRLVHLPDVFDPTKTTLRPLREGEVLEV